mmetsp:Transcript_1746/g.4669  ORF Transcript_1746/g.4669 Transcript_1746/m.4669 type:complete len:291 (+) Transcript_1746:69-941(+)
MQRIGASKSSSCTYTWCGLPRLNTGRLPSPPRHPRSIQAAGFTPPVDCRRAASCVPPGAARGAAVCMAVPSPTSRPADFRLRHTVPAAAASSSAVHTASTATSAPSSTTPVPLWRRRQHSAASRADASIASACFINASTADNSCSRLVCAASQSSLHMSHDTRVSPPSTAASVASSRCSDAASTLPSPPAAGTPPSRAAVAAAPATAVASFDSRVRAGGTSPAPPPPKPIVPKPSSAATPRSRKSNGSESASAATPSSAKSRACTHLTAASRYDTKVLRCATPPSKPDSS